ncbi:MAG TPA: hypothetical protein ENJ64_04085, partial [Thiotrichales bacterium]|nr:hypothetical protein [Thiotrichales bacterium]
MVDKSKTESVESVKQQSSEAMFLRGSDGEDIARRKVEEQEGLKLDDSQEELALQNIQRGSEQREHGLTGSEDRGDGLAAASQYSDQGDGGDRSEAGIEAFQQGDRHTGSDADSQPGAATAGSQNAGLADNNDAGARRAFYGNKNDSADNRDSQPRPATQTEAQHIDTGGDQPATPTVLPGNPATTADTIEERINNNVEDQINRAPEAGERVQASVEEGAQPLNGQLLATDIDPGASLTYQTVEGASLPAGFRLSANGSWQFDPGDPAYDSLAQGDSVVFTIPVVVTDERGASDTTSIQITLNGTNDAPVAGVSIPETAMEGAAAISGQLTSTDPDDHATATFSVSDGITAPEGFVLNADGSYSFDPTDSAYNHLNVGDSEVLTIPV